jgi:hypothetical protein
MVRVCCVKECSKPYNIYGCVSCAGEAINCDDCVQQRPLKFRNCAKRIIKPSMEDATHGICKECAPEFRKKLRRDR